MGIATKWGVMLVLGLAIGCYPAVVDSPLTAKQKLPEGTYLVVSMVDPSSDFYRAAELLATRHRADIVQTTVDEIESLLPELQRRQPAMVAIVIHPDDLQINLVQTVFVLSTSLDSDPFVDFACGFITGRNGDAAVRLVEASGPTHEPQDPAITMFGVGSQQMSRSSSQKSFWLLRGDKIPVTAFQSRGETDETRDEKFINDSMRKLNRPPILLLASHGYPNGLVGGPKAADMKEVDLTGSVVFNIACYTGVTSSWYEDDYPTMTIKERKVDSEESFCLQVIDSGAAAYVAYLSPRPAGPIMMGDAMLVASSGLSIGDLRRSDANSIVLAHLMSGDDQVTAETLVDGTALAAAQTPAQIVKRMATGGVLFGDPAFKPFPEKPNTDPRILSITEQPDRLVVEAGVKTPTYHFYAAEQINYWDDRESAMRVETIVPLGDRSVAEIRVTQQPAGVEEYRWVAALEHDRGQRFLHVKMTFRQPQEMATLQRMASTGVSAQFEIIGDSASSTQQAKTIFRGGNGQ